MKIDRLVAGLSALVLAAIALGGCGESSSDPGAPERPAVQPTAPGDENDIVRIFDRWQAAFIAGDSEAVCAKLARPGKEEVAKLDQLMPNIAEGASCEQTIRAIVRTSRQTGTKQRPSKAISARIRGDRATAMVSDAGRPAEPVPFVVEDGQWKLASAGFAEYLESSGVE